MTDKVKTKQFECSTPIQTLDTQNLKRQQTKETNEPSCSTMVVKKGTKLDSVIEAINAVGVPKRGASYYAIKKYIAEKENSDPQSVWVKKAVLKGIDCGILVRPQHCKTAKGVNGSFALAMENISLPKSKANNNLKSPNAKNKTSKKTTTLRKLNDTPMPKLTFSDSDPDEKTLVNTVCETITNGVFTRSRSYKINSLTAELETVETLKSKNNRNDNILSMKPSESKSRTIPPNPNTTSNWALTFSDSDFEEMHQNTVLKTTTNRIVTRSKSYRSSMSNLPLEVTPEETLESKANKLHKNTLLKEFSNRKNAYSETPFPKLNTAPRGTLIFSDSDSSEEDINQNITLKANNSGIKKKSKGSKKTNPASASLESATKKDLKSEANKENIKPLPCTRKAQKKKPTEKQSTVQHLNKTSKTKAVFNGLGSGDTHAHANAEVNDRRVTRSQRSKQAPVMNLYNK